jgi:hypothetical protein
MNGRRVNPSGGSSTRYGLVAAWPPVQRKGTMSSTTLMHTDLTDSFVSATKTVAPRRKDQLHQ